MANTSDDNSQECFAPQNPFRYSVELQLIKCWEEALNTYPPFCSIRFANPIPIDSNGNKTFGDIQFATHLAQRLNKRIPSSQEKTAHQVMYKLRQWRRMFEMRFAHYRYFVHFYPVSSLLRREDIILGKYVTGNCEPGKHLLEARASDDEGIDQGMAAKATNHEGQYQTTPAHVRIPDNEEDNEILLKPESGQHGLEENESINPMDVTHREKDEEIKPMRAADYNGKPRKRREERRVNRHSGNRRNSLGKEGQKYEANKTSAGGKKNKKGKANQAKRKVAKPGSEPAGANGDATVKTTPIRKRSRANTATSSGVNGTTVARRSIGKESEPTAVGTNTEGAAPNARGAETNSRRRRSRPMALPIQSEDMRVRTAPGADKNKNRVTRTPDHVTRATNGDAGSIAGAERAAVATTATSARGVGPDPGDIAPSARGNGAPSAKKASKAKRKEATGTSGATRVTSKGALTMRSPSKNAATGSGARSAAARVADGVKERKGRVARGVDGGSKGKGKGSEASGSGSKANGRDARARNSGMNGQEIRTPAIRNATKATEDVIQRRGKQKKITGSLANGTTSSAAKGTTGSSAKAKSRTNEGIGEKSSPRKSRDQFAAVARVGSETNSDGPSSKRKREVSVEEMQGSRKRQKSLRSWAQNKWTRRPPQESLRVTRGNSNKPA
eukprot:GFKZ01015423.1.p1 GENE.GFKZ01015423.1~~GFKZ01015423.1.p1  ORF type:complete len:673 (-),score=85.69 GFKZ01015423.1:629-2647(-)